MEPVTRIRNPASELSRNKLAAEYPSFNKAAHHGWRAVEIATIIEHEGFNGVHRKHFYSRELNGTT
jgi:hypothetical protein